MIKGPKKIILLLLVICFASSIVFGSLVIPQPAYALPGEAMAAAVWSAFWTWAKALPGKALDHLKSKVVTDAVDIFAQRLAIKTAESIVSGNRGQGSLVEGRVFQDILKDAAGAAAGDYIGSLSEKWEHLGIDLCEPSLDIKVAITMSLLKTAQPPEPKCDLANIVKNWDKFISDYNLDDLSGDGLDKAMSSILSGVNVSFQPGRSDFSAAVKLNNQLLTKQEGKKAIAMAEATQGWFKNKLNALGNQILTSKEEVKKAEETTIDVAVATEAVKAEAALKDPKGTTLSRAISSFTKTFTAKLLNKWLVEGMNNLTASKNKQIAIDNNSVEPDPDPWEDPPSVEAKKAYFSDLAVVTFGEPDEYDPLIDFTACPSNTDMIGLNNCVMSAKFYTAFNKHEPITLQEAINLKLIDGNFPLINRGSSKNSDLQYCYKDALCYSNLQKMRLSRLIPLGWEVAANISPVDNPVTLQEVINNFNNADSEYYKLIDSDWILKAPLAQCRAQGYGPRLESKYGAGRSEICVDTQTCLQEDDDGSCLPNAWGYCTREENVWRFGGEQCNEVFASCRSFVNDQGTNYFIKDTVDFCTADEVGCQLYSTSQDNGVIDADGDMIYSWEETTPLYLNDQAGTCEGQNAGCSELIKIEPGINLLPNGGFEEGMISGYPTGWTNWNSPAVTLETDNVRDGDSSVKIITPNDTSFHGIKIVNFVTYPNTDYVFSIDAQVISGTAKILINGISGTNEVISTSADWSRLELLFNTGNTPGNSIDIYVGGGSLITEYYFDSAQLELGTSATPYKPYGQYNLTYLKKAPGYLNCQDPANARWECQNYAPVCTVNDLGCELYTPANGDPAVPGIVTSDNYCESDCNNYQSYAQLRTPIEDMFGDTPIAIHDFIYDTAQQCSLAAVGCEEFTDITDTENRMYYSSLRMCITAENENTAVYYTWEGSDTAGYQLKVWQLLDSNLANMGPCTNVEYQDDDTDGFFGQNICNDILTTIDDCSGDTNDLNCRSYIDSDNVEYLRRESKVVKVSDSCTKLRRTIGNNVAIILPEESSSCTAAVVGCHEYIGNNGSNIRLVFLDDFESSLNGWSGSPLPTLGPESYSMGGHSMKVLNTNITRSVEIRTGKSYNISFWAKSNGNASANLNIKFNNGSSSLEFNNSVQDYFSEWHYYQYGPVSIPSDYDTTAVEIELYYENPMYWIDNIILKEITDNIYVVENSWNTPTSCVNPISQLGCQEYNDRSGNIHYLLDFSRICGEDKVGCTEFIDTHNSDSPFEQTWSVANDGSSNDITVPADSQVYLVDDNQYYCTSSVKGCTEVGWQNQSSGDWYDVYMISDPDNYDFSLCGADGLGCSSYISEGTEVNLLDPGDNTCVYLENYVHEETPKPVGWYQSSSVEDGTFVGCAGASDPSLPKKRDIDWNGAAGLCQTEYDGCTEFIDPRGTQGDNLLMNGDFEINTNPETAPDFWGDATTTAFVNWSSDMGRDNTGGVQANFDMATSSNNIQQIIYIRPNIDYVFSYDINTYFYSGHGGTVRATIECDAPVSSYDTSFFVSGNDAVHMRSITTPIDTFLTNVLKFRVIDSGTSNSCTIKIGDIGGEGYFDNIKIQEQKSYYYLNDDNINGSDCNGQVSLAEGCILTLDTSNISYDSGEIITTFQSDISYQFEAANASTAHIQACDSGTSGCDANRIIRVNKDRQCAEWIACQSSSKATEMDGTEKEYCYDLGRCTELSASGTTCINWLEKDAEVLSEQIYQAREIGWSGREYSGYSLLDRYNIEDLLAKTKTQGGGNILMLSSEDSADNGINNEGLELKPTCRLFPDTESPYAITDGVSFDDFGNIVEKPLNMTQANFCNQGDDCECDYQKITYSGGEVRYYDIKSSGMYQGIYNIGFDGILGTQDDYLSPITSINKYKGFWGFCLEPDYSRRVQGYVDPNYETQAASSYPCTTWMPLDILSGEYNPAAVDIEANLGIDLDNMYYCVEGVSTEEVFVIPDPVDIEVSDWTIIYESNDNSDEYNSGESPSPCFNNAFYSENSMHVYRSGLWSTGTCVIESDYNDFTFNAATNITFSSLLSSDGLSLGNFVIQILCDDTVVNSINIGEDDNEFFDTYDIVFDTPSSLVLGCKAKLFLNHEGDGLAWQTNVAVSIDNSEFRQNSLPVISTDFYCSEFAKVGALNFNGFADTSEDFMPYNQYNNYHGMSRIISGVDLTAYGTTIIKVEPFVEDIVLNNAGTPYSVDGDFGRNDACIGALSDNMVCAVNGLTCSSELDCLVSNPNVCNNPSPNSSIPSYGTCELDGSSCDGDTELNVCDSIMITDTCVIGQYDNSCYYSNDSCGDNDDCIDFQSTCLGVGGCADNGDPCFNDAQCGPAEMDMGPCLPSALVNNSDCTTSLGIQLCYQLGGQCLGVDSATTDITMTTIGNNTLANAFTYLKNIVAKIVNIFSWNGTNYEPAALDCIDDDTDPSCDITGPAGNGEPVTVKQVVWSDAMAQNNEGADGITINNNQSGDILYNGNVLNTTLKFYAYNESGNQLPLKNLVIDWGDGTQQFGVDEPNIPASVSLKNHQHICESSCEESFVVDTNFSSVLDWSGLTSSDLDGVWGGRLSSGDIMTLSFNYEIINNFDVDSLPVYWCYDTENCAQGTDGSYLNNGQSQVYPTMSFASILSAATEPGTPNTYTSSVIVTPEMTNGCYNIGNQSGYCLKELALGFSDIASGGTITISNVSLRYGCRTNNDCQYTKFNNAPDTSLGECVPRDAGDDLNYCVDDTGGGIGYFSFNHTYLCSAAQAANNDDLTTNSCVFVPRVYVEDSWGWCAAGYNDNSTVCKDGDGSVISWLEYPGNIIITP